MALFLSICLCHDLLCTLKDPFQPGGRRVKFYIAFSFIFAAILSFLTEETLDSKCKDENHDTGTKFCKLDAF